MEVWKNTNGHFPSKIVVIRDGVGDGQLDHCKRYEVEQMESVLRELGLDTKICFVVVQKRINTRVFSISKYMSFLSLLSCPYIRIINMNNFVLQVEMVVVKTLLLAQFWTTR